MNEIKPEKQLPGWLRARLPKFRKLKRRDIIQLLISLICALFLWGYISSTIAPDYSRHFKNIPVKVDLTGTRAAGYELSLLPTEVNNKLQEMTVSADIYGTRAEIGGLTGSEVVVYVDFDSVTDTVGVQNLPLKLRTTNGAKLMKYELPFEYVDVELDHYEYRAFPVTVDSGELNAAEGTRISTDKITVDPAEVQIYGPSTLLEQLDHVSVNAVSDEPLTQDCTLYSISDFTLLDKNENAVSNTALTVQRTEFAVSVPVFYSKTLPVTVDITKVPDNFDLASVLRRIRLTVNGETHSLPGYEDPDAGLKSLDIIIETDDKDKKAELDGTPSWEIGKIPLNELNSGSIEYFTPTVGEDYIDRSNYGTITVTLDSTDLISDTRWINNSDILLMNGNSDHGYAFESPGGKTPVTLIGTEEDLAKISDEDIKASLNLTSITVSYYGVYTQPFTVTLPDTANTVWISPAPTVNIMVSAAQNP